MARPDPQFRRLRRPAFTLTELLIVIALIVLFIALAVPVFKALSGGRSTDAARNQIAAALGRARMEAIGLQHTTGILFIKDGAERIGMVLVTASGTTSDAQDSAYTLAGIDAVPDREILYLPIGVSVQTIDNAAITSSSGSPPKQERMDDSYIGFRRLAKTDNGTSLSGDNYRCGGLILFDAQGRLVSQTYALRLVEPDPNAGATAVKTTRLAEIMKVGSTGTPYFTLPHSKSADQGGLLRSQLGFVLFDAAEFNTKFGGDRLDPDADWQLGNGGGQITPAELAKEDWIDDYAEPVLINRYSGALIRGG